MYFYNEVRNFDEIGKGESAKISGPETKLATGLIEELSNDAFEPEKYEDEYAQRVLEMVKKKAEGEESPGANAAATGQGHRLDGSVEKKPW